MVNGSGPGADSDLRRRAAWLLAALALAAVLFVIILTSLTGKDSPAGPSTTPGPLDTASPNTSGSRSSGTSTLNSASQATSAPASSAVAAGQAHCPTQAPCALDTDVGNAAAAITAYRLAHRLPAVSVHISPPAQQCALHNGDGCTGGWAETELATADGAAAVSKIARLAHLSDRSMTTAGVGWAYDPQAKLYYFAIVRNA